jgi:hypothetical protein
MYALMLDPLTAAVCSLEEIASMFTANAPLPDPLPWRGEGRFLLERS